MPVAMPVKKTKKKTATTKKRTTRKRRRRKRGKTRFKTGYHHSPKCKNGPAKYRSGWEKTVCEFLDQDDDVLYYEHEPFELKWCSNVSTGRIRTYIPDFLIIYCNGTKKLVEVKSLRFLNKRHVQKKAMVGKSWANKNKATYEFFLDDDIKRFKKILEQKKARKTLSKRTVSKRDSKKT